MTSDEARFVAAFLDSLFPVTPRIHGVDFDAFVSNADVNGYPLEDITVPVWPSIRWPPDSRLTSADPGDSCDRRRGAASY